MDLNKDRAVHSAEKLFYKLLERPNRPFGMTLLSTKDEWRRARMGYIGASDAPTLCGLTDAWKTAKMLFDEKTGTAKNEKDDLSDNELVQMGVAEEPLVRQLFALEHPEYDVYDGSLLMFTSIRYPWMSCSLDAVAIHRETGEICDLEIKCAPWSNKWAGAFVPDNYFVQLLWQLAVTGFRFAHLRARLRFGLDVASPVPQRAASERCYTIDSGLPEIMDQTEILIEKGRKFNEMIKCGRFFPHSIAI